MPSKVYFLMPTRHSPQGGPVSLGSIIADPREPEISLNWPLSETIRNIPIHESEERQQKREIGQEVTLINSIWAKFSTLAGAGDIGVDVAPSFSREQRASYSFDKIITREIFPSIDTVRAAFLEPSIQQSIKNRKWRQSLFMIVGVEIVHGACVEITTSQSPGIATQLGADLTPATIPISVGVGLEFEKSNSQSLSSQYSTPFVFAYRLRQIMYRKKLVERQRDYRHGDLLGGGPEAGSSESGKLLGQQALYEAEVDGIMDEDDEDLPDSYELYTEEVKTGEVSCIVAFPEVNPLK